MVVCCARLFRSVPIAVIKTAAGLWIICRASFQSSSRWGTPLKHRSNWVEVACSPSRLFTTSKPGFRKEPGFCFLAGRIVDHRVKFIKNSMPCDGAGIMRCCSVSSVPAPSEVKCGSPQSLSFAPRLISSVFATKANRESTPPGTWLNVPTATLVVVGAAHG